jgi:GxxExxY protein
MSSITCTIDVMATNVWNILGPGFSESVYHKALEIELRSNNFLYDSERNTPVLYKNHTIGNVRPDIIILDQLIIELKSISKLNDDSKTQITMYIHLLQLPGVLINFPTKEGNVEIIHYDYKKKD